MQIQCKVMQRLLRYASTYASPSSCMHLHMHASPCKPTQARHNFKVNQTTRSGWIYPQHVLTCVSVVFRCVAAKKYLLVHRTCICKHDAKSSCSDFSDMQVHMHRACIVFAWCKYKKILYLHCICMGSACICKSHASPRTFASFYLARAFARGKFRSSWVRICSDFAAPVAHGRWLLTVV